MNEAEIFAAAIKLSGDARHAFLDAACGQDAGHREQVEALLKAHDESGGLLPKLSDSHRDETHAVLGQAVPGVVIGGRYKLLEQIGEGGMGTVWVAEQSEPVKRKVALKLIKAGMDSKSVLARFEAERQALAVMDHPNIAKVLDGGLTETGRPYFVMDYVKGIPITEYCDATRLSVPDRLQLFVQVCQAVQHAHQKGIIHRDLKPSNILVAPYDDKPVPKVIDFGLAKAMNQSLTDKTLHTAHDMVLGTPQYMSPEQATFNNLDIDTRSDVYSLGTLLYELLAGSPPFAQQELEKRGLLEILRVVREEEPPRPSLKLSTAEARASISANRSSEPAQLSSMMKGEIDWIVMKALEKDRLRRYETATALAKDVQRYLNGDAVEACPPTLGYRMRKAYRRNRRAVLVAGAFVMLMCVAVVVSSLLAIKATRAESLAKQKGIESEANAIEAQKNSELYQRESEAHMRVSAEAKTTACGLQVDLDLAEMRTDPRVGLLRLARPRTQGWNSNNLQVVAAGENSPPEELPNLKLDELSIDDKDGKFKKLREFVTAAVLTIGQTFAPLLPPLSHDGHAILQSNLNSDEKSLVTLGTDATARIWDIQHFNQIAILREGSERVVQFGCSPNGKTIYTGDYDSVVRFWNANDGRFLAKTELRSDRFIYEDNLDFETVTIGAPYANSVSMGDTRALIHTQHLSSFGYNQDTYYAGEKGAEELWDIDSGQLIRRFDMPTDDSLDCYELIPDRNWILEVRHKSGIAVFSSIDGRDVAFLPHLSQDYIRHTISPNRQRIITVSQGIRNEEKISYTIRVWSASTWKVLPDSFLDGLRDCYEVKFLTNDLVRISTLGGREIFYRFDEAETEILPALTVARNGGELLLGRSDQLFDGTTTKRLNPPTGCKYHPSFKKLAYDGRFVFDVRKNTDYRDHLSDSVTEKQIELNWTYQGERPPYISNVGHVALDDNRLRVLPNSKHLDITPAVLQLWAQVAVRGELGPDGEFVKWNEETWEQKRRELATVKPPYDDFPFPGYVATDKLHWLRAEYEAANDEKEKITLANKLLRRSEEYDDKNEAVRWRTELAKYASESGPPEQEAKSQ